MSKEQREARRWLAAERAYAAVPMPDGAPDRIAELERREADRRANLVESRDAEQAPAPATGAEIDRRMARAFRN